MATGKIGGLAGGAEGFRAARRALQELGQPSGAARPATEPGAATPAAAAAPTGRILSITPAEGRTGVRTDKVLMARERIAEGYYDQPRVRGELVDSLLRSFGERE